VTFERARSVSTYPRQPPYVFRDRFHVPLKGGTSFHRRRFAAGFLPLERPQTRQTIRYEIAARGVAQCRLSERFGGPTSSVSQPARCLLSAPVTEADGRLMPVEIKKTASPDKRLSRVFSVFDRSQLPRGMGAILCMVERLTAIDSQTLAVPISLI